MFAYYILLAFIIVAGIYEEKVIQQSRNSCPSKRNLAIIVFLILFTFTVIRDSSVGGDLPNYAYKLQIEAVRATFLMALKDPHVDFGFYALLIIISRFTTNIRSIMVVTAVISLPLLMITFYRYSKRIWLSVYLFIIWGGFVYLFSGLRAMIAISFVLYAFHFIEKKKPFRFMVIIIIASLFHKTALIALPMYYYSNRRLKKILQYT